MTKQKNNKDLGFSITLVWCSLICSNAFLIGKWLGYLTLKLELIFFLLMPAIVLAVMCSIMPICKLAHRFKGKLSESDVLFICLTIYGAILAALVIFY